MRPFYFNGVNKLSTEEVCSICGRPLGDSSVTEHHLVPKSLGGKVKIPLHAICHNKIHHTFTNKELEKVYNTVEAICAHPEMVKFRKWIKNKPIDFYDGHKDTASRKQKRKRR